MDDENDGSGRGGEELEPRSPGPKDLVELCRILNDLDARYVVVGGFAIRGAGYERMTVDIDLIVDTSLENEAKVYKALESLPRQAVKELKPGDGRSRPGVSPRVFRGAARTAAGPRMTRVRRSGS
jgi:hypothetical protein